MALIDFMHDFDGGEGTQQPGKRRSMCARRTRQRRRILGLIAEMVGESEFSGGLNDLGDSRTCQHAFHRGGRFGVWRLVR
jgi:hypothetical protein